MEVKHLQSLIKLNSTQIYDLEETLRYALSYPSMVYPNSADKLRKKIKRLAILQRELKTEIAEEISRVNFENHWSNSEDDFLGF